MLPHVTPCAAGRCAPCARRAMLAGPAFRASLGVRSSIRWSVLALVAALPALRPPLFVTPLAGVSPEQPSRRPEAGRHAACGGLTFPPYRSLRSLGGNGPGSRPNAVRGRGPAPAPSAQHGSPPSQAVRRANGPPLRCGPSSRRTAWGLPRGGYRPRGRVLSVGSVGASPALASDTPTARRAPEHPGRRGRPPTRPPGSLARLAPGVATLQTVDGRPGPASFFSRCWDDHAAHMAAKGRNWLGEWLRPLAALLLWVLGMVPLIAAPPLLPSLAETRVGGVTAFPVDGIPAAPLYPSDLHRVCGPPLEEVASGSPVAPNRGAGQGYAATVTPGGSGRAFAGHGEFRLGSGEAVVPEGTSLTTWTTHGRGIPDRLGQLVERGDYAAIAADPGLAAAASGSRTFLPGASLPNYVLKAPDGLNIMGASKTVESATPLSDLLRPGMGAWDWAACQKVTR